MLRVLLTLYVCAELLPWLLYEIDSRPNTMIDSIQLSPSKELSQELVLEICKRLDSEAGTYTHDVSTARYLGINITCCHVHETEIQRRHESPTLHAHLVKSACSSLADMEMIRTAHGAVDDALDEANDASSDSTHETDDFVRPSCSIVTSSGTIEVYSGEMSDCSCSYEGAGFLSSSVVTVKNATNMEPQSIGLVDRVHIDSGDTKDVNSAESESKCNQDIRDKSETQKTTRWKSFKTKLRSKLRRISKRSRSTDDDLNSNETNSLDVLFENSCGLESTSARSASTNTRVQDASEPPYRSQCNSAWCASTNTSRHIQDAPENSNNCECNGARIHASPASHTCDETHRQFPAGRIRPAGNCRGVPNGIASETNLAVSEATHTQEKEEKPVPEVDESGLIHPLSSVIRDRLIQWKKRPKRKFKVKQLLSCTRS